MLKFLTIISVLILNPPLKAQEFTKSTLLGKWSTNCSAGKVSQEDFSENQATLSEYFFLDPHCTEAQMLFTSVGFYTIPFSQAMDFSFSSLSLSLFTSALVNNFNDREVCGFKDWQLGQKKEITGLRCEIFQIGRPTQIPKEGDLRFGIFKITENQLYFGLNDSYYNSRTADRRPIEFNPTPFYKR